MIMRKKILSLLLAFAMIFFVTACGESGKTKATVAENAGEGMKIAIVSSPAGVDDHSFNEDNYNGILTFIESHPGATVTPVQESTGDTAAALATVADIVADYNVIVCCGFQFAGISEIAQKNPDVKFILVDTFPSDAKGNEVEVDNIFAMCFAEQESGFFAGMAAALETKTGKVAVVNGVAYPSNVNYQYGFECGVKYVNGTEGKKVKIVELPAYAGTDVTGADVGGNYIGSFADIETGKIIGKALIAEGVDVIFTAAGTAGSGVLAAVKEADGVWYIGCDIDQYDDGADGNRNVMLTSAIKVMHRDVERTLNAISVGFFGGGNVTLQADTGSTGYVSTEGRNQLSAETIKKLDAAYESLILGDIVPAANFNGITPDSFTWK
ncbi:MAG: BMP family ABC transporter substrate-binding protein [Acetatifactor sp.]|nr:BMP family ABC transporter substrate-binding protein [Acetatifactor sp.]MDE7112600.1 BMP family ABC transporter substrate-binding protein [Acetatifactor sp.]